MCYCLLVSSGPENWFDQRLQFHVCTTFFLSSWPFWLFWSFWALITSLYSLSQCYKILLCFVFVSSKTCQELDIHWVLGIQNRLTRMYYHIHTFCRLYSVIFQSIHSLGHRGSSSVTMREQLHEVRSRGGRSHSAALRCNPDEILDWSNLCWGEVLCLAM